MKNNWMKKLMWGLVLLVSIPLLAQANPGDELIGIWKPSNGRSMLKIEKIGSKYYGRVVWLKEPVDENGDPRTDVNNPDESLRSTPLKGYRVLKDFVYDEEEGIWTDGTIYDPQNGSTYNCKIELINETTIEVRGYIGTAVFGRTDTWTKMVKKK
jgi:uncharacterized protein (DUF2147 family)